MSHYDGSSVWDRMSPLVRVIVVVVAVLWFVPPTILMFLKMLGLF